MGWIGWFFSIQFNLVRLGNSQPNPTHYMCKKWKPTWFNLSYGVIRKGKEKYFDKQYDIYDINHHLITFGDNYEMR